MPKSVPIPALTTARLSLRAFGADDIMPFAAIQADPEVMRFIGVGAAAGRPRSPLETWQGVERILGQWALRGYGMFALEERATGRLIGRAGILHPLDWPEPELGWLLARDTWGQGFATEAAGAARDWAFAAHGFERLASFILPDNTASARVAARLGATREGAVELSGLIADRWVHPAPGRGAVA